MTWIDDGEDPAPFVSWIVLVFVGVREVSDLVVEVDTEVKELREGQCWSFQVRCHWTCSPTLFGLLIVTTVARGGGMVR